MTTYAYAPSTTTLLAVRETGVGATAAHRPVARTHPGRAGRQPDLAVLRD